MNSRTLRPRLLALFLLPALAPALPVFADDAPSAASQDDPKDAAGQYALAVRLASPEGAKPADLDRAAKLLDLAAKAGHTGAMNALGAMFLNGKQGVDGAAARSWFDKAEKAGSADATNNIGVMFAESPGVGDDGFKESVRWFEKASKAGCAAASFNRAQLLHQGKGCPKDLPAAMKLYTTAAQAGHAKAAWNLAVLAATGEKPDPAQAVKWLEQAAEHGDAKAKQALETAKARHRPELRPEQFFADFTLATPIPPDTKRKLGADPSKGLGPPSADPIPLPPPPVLGPPPGP